MCVHVFMLRLAKHGTYKDLYALTGYLPVDHVGEIYSPNPNPIFLPLCYMNLISAEKYRESQMGDTNEP